MLGSRKNLFKREGKLGKGEEEVKEGKQDFKSEWKEKWKQNS